MLFLMSALHAEQIGFIVYAALYAILFHERLLYLGVCGAMAVIGGHELLEYAPAVFLPIEIIVTLGRVFSYRRR